MGKWKKISATFAVVLLAVFSAAWFWASPQTVPAQRIFHGGNIITMDPAHPSPEAVYIKNGEIQALGTLGDMQALAPRGTPLQNLDGATLMPGLIEPHSHPIASAQFAATIDVSGFAHTNRAAIIETLKNEIPDAAGAWAIAFGWDPVMVDDLEPPTLAELDALSPDKPLLILTQMMHDAYANSAAFEAAGITRNTANPPAGEFVRDKDGNLTGTLREISAIGAMFAAMPKPPAGANDLLLNLQFARYAKAGYTTVAAVGLVGNDADPAALVKRRASAKHAPVQMSVYALPTQLSPQNRPENTAGAGAVIGVKFWMDGSPYVGGAATDAPYENTPLTLERLHLSENHEGQLMIDAAEYEAQFTDYHTRGFQIATHVQGEKAVERVLNVAERVLKKHPRPDHRHRLEHNALITAAQLERAKALGFTTSFFIDHIRYYGGKLPALFGAERTERYMPIGTALKAGHKVTVHGDHPATPIGSLQTLHTMIARTPVKGDNTAPIGVGEKLSREDALKAMTINAAWQLGLEGLRGSITVGKQADFAILSANPLTVPVDDIPHIVVLGTWIKGQPVDTRTVTSTNAALLWNTLLNY